MDEMDYVVCTCMTVMQSEIIEDIKQSRITSLADAARERGIGTGCKSCICEVEELIKKHRVDIGPSGCCKK